jgi:hypothetical protein
MTVAANRLKGARLVRVNSRPRQLWDESPLWVDTVENYVFGDQ